MKYLATIHDDILNKDYDLYEMNAKAVEKMVRDTYKMSDVRIQSFNDAIELSSQIAKLKSIIEGKRRTYPNEGIDEVKKEIQSQIEIVRHSNHIGTINQVFGEMGYELMPIAISVKDKDMARPDCKVELIDGFRRMFFIDSVPDKNILVKVYDELSDTDWINAMVMFNSWKFAEPQKRGVVGRFRFKKRELSQEFIDRGFRLGLYYRYGIDFINLNSYTYDDIWDLMDIYINARPYNTLWNNNQFYNDIVVLNKIENYKPVFSQIVGKKTPKEERYDCHKVEYDQPKFLRKIFRDYIAYLGMVRREEFKKEKVGIAVSRKPFSLDTYIKFLAREDLQQHFIKLSTMSVPGYIDNYVERYMDDEIKTHLYKEYFGEAWKSAS